MDKNRKWKDRAYEEAINHSNHLRELHTDMPVIPLNSLLRILSTKQYSLFQDVSLKLIILPAGIFYNDLIVLVF